MPTSLTSLEIENKFDDGFTPAALWIAAYERLAQAQTKSRAVTLDLLQQEGVGYRVRLTLLPDEPQWRARNERRVERLVKTLLWTVGGWDICIDGADDLVSFLARTYGKDGARAFDNALIGEKIYGRALRFRAVKLDPKNPPALQAKKLGGHLEGNRIGFDLGGSDRKCAAVVDGKVVFSEEVPWSPYFESDPQYHIDGIADSLKRAAAHLPKVDAIGGSAAGVYVDNVPKIASLFRGVPQEAFDEKIRPVFLELQKQWNGVPFEVANDGDVSALAGAAMIGENAVLGISMGTSLAAGYVDARGYLTGWLNELAFVPVDYADEAPRDEWSGDIGCGVQYFSQQGVQRLCRHWGGEFADATIPAARMLEMVQERMAAKDERAVRLFESIGERLGYALPLYAEFYDIRHVLLLGRVLSGEGGELILKTAKDVLEKHFSHLPIDFVVPDESFKRHGQAIVAASLPEL